MEKQLKEEFEIILERYGAERGRRPMFQPEALELCRQAYESGDSERIEWVRHMGKDPGKVLSNISSHIAASRFGFDPKELDVHGWLERPDFLGIEEVAFRVDKEPYLYNYIEIGHGKNMKWTYATCMCYGNGSSSYGLSVFNVVCESRDQAVEMAISELTAVIKRTQRGEHLRESDRLYLDRVLLKISGYNAGRSQLRLF